MTTSPDELEAYRSTVVTLRQGLACDATALLRLEGRALVPVAVDGLSDEVLGRRFVVEAHPRLARVLESGGLLRFAADCGLPDPYDGLVVGPDDLVPVHDCVGAVVRQGGEVWGVVTFDTLRPGAFDGTSDEQWRVFVARIEAALEGQRAAGEGRARGAGGEAPGGALRALREPRTFVGTSAALGELLRAIDTVAGSDLSVLVLGETGSGKELVVERLHARSRRAARPLVYVNCAALPAALVESELFGHAKGAFTGAVHERAGKFELAHGSTLFLDEVGELPLAAQASLLRVLQSGELQRPGSDAPRRVDVRVVAATNRDLPAEIAAGRFRADLYHRLSAFPLRVPPLRERGRDVLALAGSFLEENQYRLGTRNLRLAPAATTALLAAPWLGNVRKLEHAVDRAVLYALAEQGRDARWVVIEARHLGLDVGAARPRPAPPSPAAPPPAGGTLREAVDAFQRSWVGAALARHGGNVAAAAREAGVDRSNFHRLIKRLGLEGDGDRAESSPDRAARARGRQRSGRATV
ncbi:MAG TPA: nitric oxide reductase transcriptional regulator NorR [Polyangiaceae bacterium]|nr:nitric oxide reductase transcriptional regulator NorR [Polyangiaceae bacterium]